MYMPVTGGQLGDTVHLITNNSARENQYISKSHESDPQKCGEEYDKVIIWGKLFSCYNELNCLDVEINIVIGHHLRILYYLSTCDLCM